MEGIKGVGFTKCDSAYRMLGKMQWQIFISSLSLLFLEKDKMVNQKKTRVPELNSALLWVTSSLLVALLSILL